MRESTNPRTQCRAWERHLPPLTAWTSRLFFASIGFAVPVAELFSVPALAFGSLLAAIAVGSKVVTGAWEWQHRWAVGWAMVGRGELGFVMAEEGYRTGLTSKLTFAVTVWALLIATLLSPVAFRRALAAAPLDEGEERRDEAVIVSPPGAHAGGLRGSKGGELIAGSSSSSSGGGNSGSSGSNGSESPFGKGESQL